MQNINLNRFICSLRKLFDSEAETYCIHLLDEALKEQGLKCSGDDISEIESDSVFSIDDIIIHKDDSSDILYKPHTIIQVDYMDKKYRLDNGGVVHFSEQDKYEIYPINITPKFKVGDTVCAIDSSIREIRVIKSIRKSFYVTDSGTIPLTSQNNWVVIYDQPFEIERDKWYVCINDFFSGGNKRASVGDVIKAKGGMSMMGLDADARVYFRPAKKEEIPVEKPYNEEMLKHELLSVGGYVYINPAMTVGCTTSERIMVDKIYKKHIQAFRNECYKLFQDIEDGKEIDKEYYEQ